MEAEVQRIMSESQTAANSEGSTATSGTSSALPPMRRTQRQASRAALTQNEEVELSNSIYKKALKEATTLVRAGGTLRKTMDAMLSCLFVESILFTRRQRTS